MKTRTLGIFAAILVGGTNASLAVPTIPGGEGIRFNISSGFDEASVGYSLGCGTLGPGGLPDSPSAGACDGDVGTPARNVFSVTTGAGTGFEDTWGVFRIDSLVGDTSGVFFNDGDNGEYITGIFYGLNDGIVDVGPVSSSTFSYGGVFDVYLDTTDDLAAIPDPDDRTTLTTFTGASEGTLLLRLEFAPGGNADVPDASLSGSFNNTSIAGGSGSLFDVTGGLWAPIFDTDGSVGFDGVAHDMELSVAFRCGPGAIDIACNPNNTNPDLFSVEFDGSFRGRSIPEPATLGLLALGLLGLSAFRLRKNIRL